MTLIKIINSSLHFLYSLTISKEWKNNEYFDIEWKERIRYMSNLIDDNTSSIADIGCGKCWLKDFLPKEVKYYGLDYTSRNNSTIVIDLNKREFTSLSFDTCFCSGVIEYIEMENLKWLFDTLNKKTNSLIISYCSLDLNPVVKSRKAMSWKNHLTKIELVNLIESSGFKLLEEGNVIQGNNIFKFKALSL